MSIWSCRNNPIMRARIRYRHAAPSIFQNPGDDTFPLRCPLCSYNEYINQLALVDE